MLRGGDCKLKIQRDNSLWQFYLKFELFDLNSLKREKTIHYTVMSY
jgi:hypothetical protein